MPVEQMLQAPDVGNPLEVEMHGEKMKAKTCLEQ